MDLKERLKKEQIKKKKKDKELDKTEQLLSVTIWGRKAIKCKQINSKSGAKEGITVLNRYNVEGREWHFWVFNEGLTRR